MELVFRIADSGYRFAWCPEDRTVALPGAKSCHRLWKRVGLQPSLRLRSPAETDEYLPPCTSSGLRRRRRRTRWASGSLLLFRCPVAQPVPSLSRFAEGEQSLPTPVFSPGTIAIARFEDVIPPPDP